MLLHEKNRGWIMPAELKAPNSILKTVAFLMKPHKLVHFFNEKVQEQLRLLIFWPYLEKLTFQNF